jgi:hypothetical protein
MPPGQRRRATATSPGQLEPGTPGYKCTTPGQSYYLALNRVAVTGGNPVLHFEDSGETRGPPARRAGARPRPPSASSSVWDLIYRDFATADRT